MLLSWPCQRRLAACFHHACASYLCRCVECQVHQSMFSHGFVTSFTCPASVTGHVLLYCPDSHVIKSEHWVYFATHASWASRFTLGGATPTTHRSRVDRSGWWLGGYCVFLTQHTTPHNHTQPSICDGAHKLKDCARAQMQGCVFRGLLAQGTTFMLACRM